MMANHEESAEAHTKAPLRVFDVWASDCDLQVQMEVMPETVVGVEVTTGEQKVAGCYGQVEALRPHDSELTLVVEIRPHAPKPQRIAPDVLLFKVAAHNCQWLVGDIVVPNAIIGNEPITGAPLPAGCHGYIEAIDPLAGHDTLMILVREMIAPDVTVPRPVIFKVRDGVGGFRVGDRVKPETLLGTGYDSNNRIYAGCQGRVRGVRFNESDQALLIMVSQD